MRLKILLSLFLFISLQFYLPAQNTTVCPGNEFIESAVTISSTPEIFSIEPVIIPEQNAGTDWLRTIAVFPDRTTHSADNSDLTKQIKTIKNTTKRLSYRDSISNSIENFNPNAEQPLIFRNFEANVPMEGTPTDNTIAVSNGGIIVVAINSNIRYYKTDGTLLFSKTFYDFIGDTNLKSKLYDPQVIYDPGADRFVFVVLHGSHSSTSKVIILFSKTNNPENGWNRYYFPITTINSTFTSKWFDFPKIGVSNDDLFVTGNIFKNDEGGFSESIIMQINKTKGYTGKSLEYRIWRDLKDADNGKPFSIYPVSWGKNGTYGPSFFLLSTKSSGNTNRIYLYEITNKLGSTNPSPAFKAYGITTGTYLLAADALQKKAVPNIDPGMLDIGDCKIQSAFYQISNGEGIIHFVFHSEYNQSVNGICYNRLNVKTLKNTYKLYANASFDYAYPAIASSSPEGDDSRDIIMVYLTSSSNTFPGIEIVSCDNNMNFSIPKEIKAGETNVNYVLNEDERWGDYTGISRKHNTSAPRIWISGAFGGNIKTSGFPPVTIPSRFRTYIAEVSDDANTTLSEEVANEVRVFPNPVYDVMNVKFYTPQSGMVEISIYNESGQLVTKLFNDYVKQGNVCFRFNKSALGSGIYFVRILASNKLISNEKIMVFN